MSDAPIVTPALIADLELLARFNPRNIGEGLKIHHDADAAVRDAAQRLYDKRLITQADGGFLTDAGIEALQHLQVLFSVLAAD